PLPNGPSRLVVPNRVAPDKVSAVCGPFPSSLVVKQNIPPLLLVTKKEKPSEKLCKFVKSAPSTCTANIEPSPESPPSSVVPNKVFPYAINQADRPEP